MTASELAEHRDGGHLPYHSGRPDCVEAFGHGDGHASHDKLHGRTIPTIRLDYLFVTPEGIYTYKEFEDIDPELFAQRDNHPDVMKAIVIFSSKDKCISCHAVPRKGPDPYVVQCIVNDIAWLGHTTFMLRSDNDPAMLALIADALRGLRAELDLETVAAEGSGVGPT